MDNLKINHMACIAAIVLTTILGFLWYGPLFGDKWMQLVGLSREGIESNPPGAAIWVTNLVATVIPVYFLAWIFIKLNVESGARGALIGFGIAFSFVFLSEMTQNMFSMRPYILTWIEGGYSLAALTLTGFLLGAWRKYSS